MIGNRQSQGKTAVTAPAQAGGTAAAPAPPPRPPRGSITFGRALMGVGAILLLAAAIPFLMGAKNLIGLLIIGFGLWEAWKLNRRTDLSISGRFQVKAASAAGPPSS